MGMTEEIGAQSDAPASSLSPPSHWPAQLFTAALARAKGLDVDRPRGLNKVTITR